MSLQWMTNVLGDIWNRILTWFTGIDWISRIISLTIRADGKQVGEVVPDESPENLDILLENFTSLQPVSPPFGAKHSSEYSCYVDWSGKLYELSWTGNMEYPDLSAFPKCDAKLKRVELGCFMAQTWKNSTLVDYGANSCVRKADDCVFPIIKLAHPNKEARALVQYEFSILNQMTKHSLPIPRFDPEPLADEDGIFGYRLEALTKVEYAVVQFCYDEMESLLNCLHKEGFSHGDVSPSNVMKNKKGEMVLIDFSFSGILGATIPDQVPNWAYRTNIFDVHTDKERLDKFFKRK